MTPTNVVSMNFKEKVSLDDFVKMYQKDSPKLYPDAEILMFIKLTDTSAVAISVYPNEEARINSKKLAEICAIFNGKGMSNLFFPIDFNSFY